MVCRIGLISGLAIATLAVLTSSCQSDSAIAPPPSPAPSPVPTPLVSPSPSPSPSLTPEPATLLATAEDTAAGATAIAQSASTPADWQLVAAQLQKAVDLLTAIPDASAESEVAATLLTDYEEKLAIAQERGAAAPDAQSTPTATGGEDLRVRVGSNSDPAATAEATPAGANNPGDSGGFPTQQRCQGPLSRNDRSVRLRDISLYKPTPADSTLVQDGRTYLVGCLLNQGDSTLPRITVSYTYRRGETVGQGVGQLTFPNIPVGTRRTVPFRSVFTLDPGIQSISLLSIDSVYGDGIAISGMAERGD